MTAELDAADAATRDLLDAAERGMDELDRSDITPAEVVYTQPWDQQVGETDFKYKLFLHYRDQGPGRQVKITWRWYLDEELGTAHENSFYTYSREHEWRDRASSWDQFNERQYQIARVEAIREMADRHADELEAAIEAVVIPMQALARRMDADPDFLDGLSRTDAKKLIEMSNRAARTLPQIMQAERLARGMPTEIVSGTIEHQHTVVIERDQIGEILDVLAAAGALPDGNGTGSDLEIIDAEVVDVHPVSADGDDERQDSRDQP